MRILLIGEYSNVHWTLAEGIRELGHEVCVLSNGDFWKNYKRDINLERTPGKLGGIIYMFKLLSILPRLKNYDVVQIINPCFLELKVEKSLKVYHYLNRHNKRVFLAGYGNDYYWVNACANTDTFRYSDFQLFGKVRSNAYTQGEISTWVEGIKGEVNKEIARTCDGIITGLYEYHASYYPFFPEKMTYIPFPVNINSVTRKMEREDSSKVRFFIGIQKTRNEIKGTDILYKALVRVQEKYPDHCEIVKAESVPFYEYEKMMSSSDVVLDQLYAYTPGMNGLLAMCKGLILVGGGEPENYDILGENELRPIVNVLPDEENVFLQLEQLVLNKERLPQLSKDSIEYIRRHHDHVKVARQYLEFWSSKM